MDPAIRVVDHLHRTLKFAAQYFAEQEPVSSEVRIFLVQVAA